jgi:hypothetical protein
MSDTPHEEPPDLASAIGGCIDRLKAERDALQHRLDVLEGMFKAQGRALANEIERFDWLVDTLGIDIAVDGCEPLDHVDFAEWERQGGNEGCAETRRAWRAAIDHARNLQADADARNEEGFSKHD